MTDLERFVELYQSFGIECVVTYGRGRFENLTGKQITLTTDKYVNDGSVTVSKKFIGYPGFYTTIFFDNDGRFISQGFWE
jgi:hypothetical protein